MALNPKANYKRAAVVYIMANIENGNDGYDDAADKLGCTADISDLSKVIHSLFPKRKYAERLISKLKQNERERQKAMASKRRTIKKQQQQQIAVATPDCETALETVATPDCELALETVATPDRKTILEREIQSVTQKISVEQLGIEECCKKLKELEADSANKVQAAEQLREQLKKLMSECVQLEEHAKETAEKQKLHEDALLQLDAQLLELKSELRSLSILHVSIGMELEGAMLLDSYELDKTLLKSKMAEFITMPENYPEEFIELAELAEMHEVRTVARAMLVAEKLTAESGNEVVFHMKECDAATLLEYAGLKVAIEKKEG